MRHLSKFLSNIGDMTNCFLLLSLIIVNVLYLSLVLCSNLYSTLSKPFFLQVQFSSLNPGLSMKQFTDTSVLVTGTAITVVHENCRIPSFCFVISHSEINVSPYMLRLGVCISKSKSYEYTQFINGQFVKNM